MVESRDQATHLFNNTIRAYKYCLSGSLWGWNHKLELRHMGARARYNRDRDYLKLAVILGNRYV